MKKILKASLLVIMMFFLSGCGETEKSTIYTTVYPIEYLVETLYKEHSNSSSIYPDGVEISSYEFNDRLIEKYSNATLFVYNGTTNEKQIAKSLYNRRKKLKIIDVAYSLNYRYGPEELWLSPSNYLMLAANLKDGLETQLGSRYVNEEIETKFNELKETLTAMDAQIRRLAKKAQGNNKATLIVSSNVLRFLTDYGFEVISLEDYELDTPNYNSLKSNFNSGSYKYILVKSDETENPKVKDLVTNAKATQINVNMMNTLSEENKKNNETYLSIMNQFVSDLGTITND